MLRHLDLFSGIGGFTLAAQRLGGITTTQFVELDPDAATVLRSNFPDIPIHGDIRTYHPQRGEFDLITCGFPCTGTSMAGGREGLSHPDSALWREGFRCLIECRPRFFLVEQPDGIIHRGLRAILGGLRMVGYSFEVETVTAAGLGAGHRRARTFIISYPDQWLPLFEVAPRWGDQMREMVQGERADSPWLSVERRRDGNGDGLSVRLVRGSESITLPEGGYRVPTNTPGRLRSRFLAGRTVTPLQAASALRRVLYLNGLST